LAIAQQPLRDFLTEERASVSVEVQEVACYFVPRDTYAKPQAGESSV